MDKIAFLEEACLFESFVFRNLVLAEDREVEVEDLTRNFHNFQLLDRPNFFVKS